MRRRTHTFRFFIIAYCLYQVGRVENYNRHHHHNHRIDYLNVKMANCAFAFSVTHAALLTTAVRQWKK